MAAPRFRNSGIGGTDATGPWTASSNLSTAGTGNVVILQILQDGGTSSAVAMTSATNVANLAGTTSSMTYIGAFTVGGASEAIQHLWIGRKTGGIPSAGGSNSTSEDLYYRWHEFTGVSTGTTLATVIENVTAGATTNTSGTSQYADDASVTTLGPNRLMLNFLAVNDDNALGLFAGATGGQWGDESGYYAESSGTDGCIMFQSSYPTLYNHTYSSATNARPVYGDDGTDEATAQSFYTSSSGGAGTSVESVLVLLRRQGSTTDDIVVEIQTNSAGGPSGTVIASASAVASSIETAAVQWYQFTISASLSVDTKYWLVVRRSGSRDAVNYIEWHSSTGTYSGGARANRNSGTWTDDLVDDHVFAVLTSTTNAGWVLNGGSANITDAADSWGVVGFALIGSDVTVKAQAQASIKGTGRGYGQAQASISIVGRAYAQAQALIAGDYTYVSDNFNRTESDGWGTASTSGGGWSILSGTGADYDVDGAKGTINHNASMSIALKKVSIAGNISIKFRFSYDKNATVSTDFLRLSVATGSSTPPTSSSRMGLLVGNPVSSSNIPIYYRINGTDSVLASLIGYTLGDIIEVNQLMVKTSNGQTRIRQKVWKVGTTEPAWSTTVTSNQLETLPGYVKLVNQDSPSNLPILYTIDNLEIVNADWTESGQAQAKINAYGVNGFGQAQAFIAYTSIIDTFTRTVSNGIGSPNTGGEYTFDFTAQSISDVDVTGTELTLDSWQSASAIEAHSWQARVYNFEASVLFKISVLPDTNGYSNNVHIRDNIDYSTYRGFSFKVERQSGVNRTYVALDSGTTNQIQITDYVANEYWRLKGRILFTSTKITRFVKAWKNGTSEPGWQLVQTEDVTPFVGSPSLMVSSTGGAFFTLDDYNVYEAFPVAHANAAGLINGLYEVTTDNFNRVRSDTWDLDDSGQPWVVTTGSTADFDVNGSVGTIANIDSSHAIDLTKLIAPRNVEVEFTYSIPTLPTTGFYTILSLVHVPSLPDSLTSGFGVRFRIADEGSVLIDSIIDGVFNNFSGIDVYVAGEIWYFKFRVLQTLTQTSIIASTWKVGNVQQPWFSITHNTTKPRGHFRLGVRDTVSVTPTSTISIDNLKISEAFPYASGQAQATIVTGGLVTYNAFSQANASIFATSKVYAQAQAQILTSYKAYAQAQTQIKVTTNTFAQAQSSTKQIYQGYAQAQTNIKTIYNAYSQAQADIKQTYQGYAQAQVQIKQSYLAYSQTQVSIKATYNQFAQSQATIKATYNQFAQGQASIKATTNAYAQAQTQIKQTYSSMAQAQTDILQVYQVYAQTQANIIRTYQVYSQAQATIRGNAFAQAQASIKVKSNAYAQAKAGIKQTYPFGGGSTTIGQDTFTDSDKLLTAHTPEIGTSWTTTFQTTTDVNVLDWQIRSNTAALTGTDLNTEESAETVAVIAPTMADGYIQGNLVSGSSGFVVRQLTGNLDTFYVAILSSDIATLYRYTDGTIVGLGTITGSGNWIRLQVTGSSPTLLKGERRTTEGALGTGWTLETSDNTAINQASSGYVGIYGNGFEGTAFTIHSQIDSFLAVSGTEVTGPTFAQAQAKINVYGVNKFAQAQAKISTTRVYAQAQTRILITNNVFAQAQTFIMRLAAYDLFNRVVSDGWGVSTDNVISWSRHYPIETQGTVDGSSATIPSGYGNQTGYPVLKWRGIYQFDFLITDVAVNGQIRFDTGINTITINRAGSQWEIADNTSINILFTPTNNTWWTFKYLAWEDGAGTIYAKVWPQSDVEPGWQSSGNALDQNTTPDTDIAIDNSSGAGIRLDNLYIWTFGTTIFKYRGQAQASILRTYNSFAQAQSDILQSYQAYAQAQGQVVISLATYNAYAQAQSDILQSYQGFAQAQSDILQVYQAYAQAQVSILQVYQGYAQAQGQIKQAYQSYGQAQAQILQTYQGYSQAQAQIKQTYQGYSQAQADIQTTYKVYAQTQADIKSTTNAYAQGQGYILTVGNNAYGQAQSNILQAYQGFGQAQTYIITINNNVYGQAQAKINAFNVQVYGQAQGNISFTGNTQFAQAQAQINAFDYPQWAQAQADIKATSNVYAQAQADIQATYKAYAQAQADILVTSNSYAQAQADILQVYQGYAQAQSQIKQTYNQFAQAQGTILQVYQAYAQAQANIKATYNQFAQAQADILVTYQSYAQAQTDIKSITSVFAQAQGQIKQSYQAYAQAQASIKATINSYAQAQTSIKVITSTFAQAQAAILQSYQAYAQAQGITKQSYLTFAQANANIKQVYNAYSQAQGYILVTGINIYAQAQAEILQIYQVYGQAQAKINAFGVQAYAQAQGNISFQGNTAFAQVQAQINAFDYPQWAQAQASIRTAYKASGQAQADVLAVYQAYANAQADIQQTYRGFAQAQSEIKQTYQVYAQGQAFIIVTEIEGFGQAQAIILQSYLGFGQANTTIAASGYGFGQANANILGAKLEFGQAQATIKGITNSFGQAQTDILSTGKVYAQAQADILQSYLGFGQANSAIVKSVQVYAQAQSSIKATINSYGQANADVRATYQVYAQSQADIKTTYRGFAQTQTYIILRNLNGFAQAQTIILTTQTTYAQANADILAVINKSANAQAYILTNVIVFAQSQAWIESISNSFGQAQALITSGFVGLGQALALILRTEIGFAQAQALMIKAAGYGQAQALIFQTHTLKKLRVDDRNILSLRLVDRESTQTIYYDSPSIILVVSDRIKRGGING